MSSPQNSQPGPTQRIVFSYQAYLLSPLGDIFQYLLRSKSHSSRAGKQMALEAISAFWKPFSAKALLGIGDQEAKVIARRSISELQDQIELIRNAFDIKPDCQPTVTRTEVERLIDDRLSQIPLPSQALRAQPIPDGYKERDSYTQSGL